MWVDVRVCVCVCIGMCVRLCARLCACVIGVWGNDSVVHTGCPSAPLLGGGWMWVDVGVRVCVCGWVTGGCMDGIASG